MKNIAVICLLLLAGCSSERGWELGDSYPTDKNATPRLHGDERSNAERYNDCVSSARNKTSKSTRVRCYDRAQRPDPDYIGVSFPMHF
ncbi:hypothetical protein ACFSFZ_02105 [Mixta tenebrionis]|uniref:Lipoprotein n=1 Tax=Mixta tenebrionis TaxID=2562439 RepID=A0A506V896_9GAMM|nr:MULTISPECIES: hypothetical protein [Mixta]QHM77377.1 hypothetical protein C7M52_03374 [Mixta theicola]TPW41905.1 hypothetical protein FKM52_11115 [Mixta tenebrionis]